MFQGVGGSYRCSKGLQWAVMSLAGESRCLERLTDVQMVNKELSWLVFQGVEVSNGCSKCLQKRGWSNV